MENYTETKLMLGDVGGLAQGFRCSSRAINFESGVQILLAHSSTGILLLFRW